MTKRRTSGAIALLTAWRVLQPAQRRGAIGLLALTLAGIAVEALGIGLMIPAIVLLTQDDFLGHYPTLRALLRPFGDLEPKTVVIGGMLVVVAVYAVKIGFLACVAQRQQRFVYNVMSEFTQRLFAVYLRQPYTFHLERNSAQLIRNVVNEVAVFAFNGIQEGLLLVSECVLLAGLGVLLLVVEPGGTLVVVGVLGTAAWAFHGFTRKRLSRSGERRQYHEGLRLQHLQQGLGSAKEVKLLGRESDFLEQYRVHSVQSARAGRVAATLRSLPRLWLELLAVVGLALLVIRWVAQGRSATTVLPVLGLFAVTGFRLIPSANRIMVSLQSLRHGLPAIETLQAELALERPSADAERAAARPLRVAVELREVTFTYPGAATPALEDVSLAVRRGETVGVVGPSGAGKSTLVDILLGLLSPGHGGVWADGQDIRDALRSWQDQIGYVPQSIYVTDDSLLRNVAFGLPSHKIDVAAVWSAICAAQLEAFVRTLPDGLETRLGERGVRVSGGEQQRIGIARALYHDPIVLVLDEATSSLDVSTEHEVMQAVRALRGSKTIVVVSHRFSTVEHCDRLYRLERGRIVAEGPPEALMLGRHARH